MSTLFVKIAVQGLLQTSILQQKTRLLEKAGSKAWKPAPLGEKDLETQVSKAVEERERIVAALEDACHLDGPSSVKIGLERLCMEAHATEALDGVCVDADGSADWRWAR
jgi:hypothetical protein